MIFKYFKMIFTLLLVLPGLAPAENTARLNGHADYALINAKVLLTVMDGKVVHDAMGVTQ